MKKIIITGASGFIGKYCTSLLAQEGIEVHALYHMRKLDGLSQNENFFGHQINLFENDAIDTLFKKIQPTHLLHLAWYAEHGLFWNSQENLKWIQASLTIAKAFVQNGGKRFVGAGTCAEYSWENGLCQEGTTPLNPQTLYGISKNALRMVLEKYFQQNEVEFCWGRVFYPYGPNELQKRLIPSVICALLQGQLAPCTHGNQIRDFFYVEDAAKVFVDLLQSSFVGSVNIGSGQSITIKNVCEKIAEQLNGMDLLKLGALTPPLHDSPIILADVSLLQKVIGKQNYTSLDEGLKKTIKWHEKQIHKEALII